jgi:hypothetical protein
MSSSDPAEMLLCGSHGVGANQMICAKVVSKLTQEN